MGAIAACDLYCDGRHSVEYEFIFSHYLNMARLPWECTNRFENFDAACAEIEGVVLARMVISLHDFVQGQ